MDQHPVPRQITTFEFKLIGFMTLKQFIYLVIAAPIAYILFVAIPIPIINIVMAFLVALAGVLFAFLPIQDRPLEVWLRNFIKRINSPTQYFYMRKNTGPAFLSDLYYSQDPHITGSLVDTKEKLSAYLSMKSNKDKELLTNATKQKSHISNLLEETKSINPSSIKKAKADAKGIVKIKAQEEETSIKKPYLYGVVKNKKGIPLPGILISIKDADNNEIRLLKTNPHGVFATYSPFTQGTYFLSLEDPGSSYFFDTINLNISEKDIPPITIFSKELL